MSLVPVARHGHTIMVPADRAHIARTFAKLDPDRFAVLSRFLEVLASVDKPDRESAWLSLVAKEVPWCLDMLERMLAKGDPA